MHYSPICRTRGRRANPRSHVFNSSDGHCDTGFPSATSLKRSHGPGNYFTRRRRGEARRIRRLGAKSYFTRNILAASINFLLVCGAFAKPSDLGEAAIIVSHIVVFLPVPGLAWPHENRGNANRGENNRPIATQPP